jgi:hypothetical protein
MNGIIKTEFSLKNALVSEPLFLRCIKAESNPFLMSIQIQVPQPCHASWDKMTPQQDGRHCKSCDKVVVDFSQMNDDEIKDWFSKKEGKKVCGHFRVDQVKRLQIVVNPKEFKQLGWSPVQLIRVAIFLVFFSSLFSCSPYPEQNGAMTEIVIEDEKDPNDEISGKLIMPQLDVDTSKTNTIETLTGDTIYPLDSNHCTPMINGGLSVPQEILKGEALLVPEVKPDTNSQPDLKNLHIRGKVAPAYGIDHKASYPGGEKAMYNWINENKLYPEINRARMFRETVVVDVFISSIGRPSVAKFVSPEFVPDVFQNEIIRLLNEMPNWKVATKRGKPISSITQISISFQIGD